MGFETTEELNDIFPFTVKQLNEIETEYYKCLQKQYVSVALKLLIKNYLENLRS